MADDGGARRCMSDFSDDLLRHILFFAPAREGATTAVLSRRWRWLWRMSGAVNLDSQSFINGCSSRNEERNAFLHGTHEALAAALGCPIKRLRISIAEDSKIDLMRYTEHQWYERGELEHNLVDAIVSNPAVRLVEELQIDVKTNEEYTLSIGSLPSEDLRVLCLTKCSALTAPPLGGAAFPMLVDLHLQHCSVPVVDLRAIVDVAPRLSTLHLESSTLSGNEGDAVVDDDGKLVIGRLLLPAVTSLVFADCVVGCRYREEDASLELHVPRLQYFRYRGSVQRSQRLLLKPPPQELSNMIQVDLELSYDYNHRSNFYSTATQTPASDLFWQFIQNFSTTKLLKLKLDDTLTMDDVELVEKASRDELLGGLSFHLLEQLELEAKYKYEPGVQKSSMVVLADLLHRCPMVRDLKLGFGKKYEMPWGRIESSIDKEAGLHFDKSVNGFTNRRKNKPMLVSSLGSGQNNDVNYEAFGIPAELMGEHSFRFLQGHLQRLSLHFFMDEPNCTEVQLAKFFVENAMVLQEMYIDDGSQEMNEHVNSSVRGWIAKTHNVRQ